MAKKELPTIEQIFKGEIELTELQKTLETEPPLNWLKNHPSAKNEKGDPVQHLPIERIDYLLRAIYSGSWSEIIETNLTTHSIQVTLRLFVVNPENGRVEHYDGIGAASNKNGIESAAPIAESLAKKNAAKKLGKIFGRDLSREFEGIPTTNKPEDQTSGTDQPIKIDIVNPVKLRIIQQAVKCKSLKGLQNVCKAAQDRYEEKELNDEEIDEVITLIEKNKERFNKN